VSKPSRIEFGKSIVKATDLDVMKRLGYIGKKDDDLIRFAGDEIIPEPKVELGETKVESGYGHTWI
jgi:hypothetical protein